MSLKSDYFENNIERWKKNATNKILKIDASRTGKFIFDFHYFHT